MLTSLAHNIMRYPLTRDRPSPSAPYEPVGTDVPTLTGAEIAAVYYGQRQGGDFYDFIRVHPERVLFGLLDVAGKLEDTRSLLSHVQDTFRTLGASLFAADDVNESEAMVELCLRLNHAILDAAQGVHACPAFAGCYNETLGIVCYFNAGHTPGLVRDSTGTIQLPATGLPLGLFSHATCDAPMVALVPGAVLLVASRGVVEGKRHGDEFGFDRLKDNLRNSTASAAREICVGVLDNVRQFMGTAPTHNDVTALALVRATSAAEPAG
jgi:serine phosphatase RsbU (regulator of sigma subunit)